MKHGEQAQFYADAVRYLLREYRAGRRANIDDYRKEWERRRLREAT